MGPQQAVDLGEGHPHFNPRQVAVAQGVPRVEDPPAGIHLHHQAGDPHRLRRVDQGRGALRLRAAETGPAVGILDFRFRGGPRLDDRQPGRTAAHGYCQHNASDDPAHGSAHLLGEGPRGHDPPVGVEGDGKVDLHRRQLVVDEPAPNMLLFEFEELPLGGAAEAAQDLGGGHARLDALEGGFVEDLIDPPQHLVGPDGGHVAHRPLGLAAEFPGHGAILVLPLVIGRPHALAHFLGGGHARTKLLERRLIAPGQT